MKKILLATLFALSASGFFQSANATATLNILLPNNTNVFTAGKDATFDARIYINGLADFGGFDFSLTYNSTNLLAQSLTPVNVFGADTEVWANNIGTAGGTGIIHFSEFLSGTTALTSIDTAVSQPTLLGTVHFKALNVSANNAINFVNFPLVYGYDGTSLEGTMQGAAVTIAAAAPAPAPVPLPPSALMFVSALASAFGLAKKRRA